jgi:alginate O-acetyltransferase complex protein AlgI
VAIDMYAGMAGLQGWGITDRLAWQLPPLSLTALAAGVATIYAAPYLSNPSPDTPDYHTRDWPVWVQIALIFGMVLAVTRLAAQSYSPFLYFQF